MSRPRLTFIVDHLALAVAGTENQIFKLIPGVARDFHVDLVCLRENDWLPRQAEYLNCEVHFFEISNFRSPQTYLNWWRLVRHLRKSSPDIVHTFFPVANSVGVLAARAARARQVVTSRRDYGNWMTKRYLAVTKFANRWVDRIVTNSEQIRQLTERVEGFPAQRIEVVLNGIDLDQMSKQPTDHELKASLGIPAGDAVVALVANFRPVKRHTTLVEAARYILDQRSDVSFLLVGGDYEPGEPLKTAVRQLSEQLGVEKKFFYAKAEGNLLRYLSFVDIGVNTSFSEGISNAIMEYMACEIPCVVAATGGTIDLVTHDSTGWLFESGDARQLADAILHLLQNRQYGTELATRAREMLRTRMSINAMVQHFCRFYSGLIATGGRQPVGVR